MLSVIQNSITRELDNQGIKADVIYFIMSNLKNEKQQEKMLDFLVENRNTLLMDKDIFKVLYKICN